MPKKILLLSAYDAQSHRYWRKGLVEQFPDYEWQVLTLPPRYFSWRIRGNSLSWAFEQREILRQRYDLIIATSMTDLSSLRGFIPSLGHIPTILYCHENQFAYPVTHHSKSGLEAQIVTLYSALCADYLLFNSKYNQDTFLEGAETLLKKLPDHVPESLISQLKERSRVLAVPLKEAVKDTDTSNQYSLWKEDSSARVIWAARWEYDKGPEVLLGILEALETKQCDYQLCLLGQSFRNSPKEFEEIKVRFAHRLVHMGYEPDAHKYHAWLESADIVLSTAKHEFQGLSVLEAVQRGCIPIVPNALAYPELFETKYRYDHANDAATMIASASEQLYPPNVDQFEWQALRPQYLALIENALGCK